MKKLKLVAMQVGNPEVLTREQLKTVMGGYGSGQTGCTGDSECGQKILECSSGVTITTNGRCYSNEPDGPRTCHWSGCPS